jgi:hypothetical protein
MASSPVFSSLAGITKPALLNGRDAEFAKQHGLPQRFDVLTLREIMGQPGSQPKLSEMLKKAARAA